MNSVINKLKYKNQDKILIINAPEEFLSIMKDFTCEIHQEIKEKYDFILLFAKDLNEANSYVEAVLGSLNYDGYLWFCYPKGTSKKYKSDLNRNKAWDVFKQYDFRPVSQIAINEDWSALRFRDINLVNKK